MAWSFTKNTFSGDKQFGDGCKALAVLDATVTTGPDAYATGGLVLVDLASYFAADAALTAEVIDPDVSKVAYKTHWDGGTPTAGKLIVSVEDGTSGVQAQVADTTDLSVTPGTLRVRFTGKKLATYSAAYASGNGVQ